MSNSNPLTNPLFIKGTSSFAYSFLIDKFVFKNESLSQNAIFGAGVTSGLLIGQALGAYIPEILPDQAGLYQGKLVSQRVVEISVGATTGCLKRLIIKMIYIAICSTICRMALFTVR